MLAGVTSNTSGYPLSAVVPASPTAGVTQNPDGSFIVTSAAPAATCPTLVPALPAGTSCVAFAYQLQTSQNVPSNTSTATVIFLPASNLTVNVKDAKNGVAIDDYRWIIEEDKTFWIDPKCQLNVMPRPLDSNGRACPGLPVESLGYNFHTANMPVVAQGCTGPISCESGQLLPIAGVDTPVACDVGNGACRTSAAQKDQVMPGAVYLDPLKRYFISVLPGDGINTTIGGAGGPHADGSLFDIAVDCGPYDPGNPLWQAGNLGDVNGVTALCGHAMGGAPIAVANGVGTRPAANISLQETPLPTSKISVFVFEDDYPLNGENDAGGGVDVIAPNEPGLGGFNLEMFDQAGGLGDATGQITYDMFNMPVSNSLVGTIDPISGLNACPTTARKDGLVGMIPTCPHFESDGVTESPLAGQAVIANLYPGLYEVSATPAADRIAAGEEWLQTNTLDGGKQHEAFIKPNEPGYFQEFGPGGFHIAIGFARPDIINARRHIASGPDAGKGICDPQHLVLGVNEGGGGLSCTANLTVQVTATHMSRTPDQRVYSSETFDTYGFTSCYVGIGPQDGADFAFAKCQPDGTATFTGIPAGDWKLAVFDQWNDLMLDGLVAPVTVDSSGTTRVIPVTQWRTNLSTNTYFDANGNGLRDSNETGLALLATNIRYRDGSYGFFNNTDLQGAAGFNEVFPFMSWLVVESDTTRFKSTGTHVVYDAGGPVDCTNPNGAATPPPCTGIAANVASTTEAVSLPDNLRVPGAVYCADADCSAQDRLSYPTGGGANGSTGRIDPPWANTEGWQGLLGQTTYMDFGRLPFAPGENGGIKGHVIYASTRPFDDPSLSLQLSWEPGVPHVTINLYQEKTAADGTKTLQLADHTTTSSWDDWAQGFRSDGMPNMNCPGQDASSPFFATLANSKQWLDPSNPKTLLPNSSQFKCYDGWSQLNQAQPAPYDGMYKFPSVTARDTGTGKQSGTNCSVCVPKPVDPALGANDYEAGAPMLPAGRYVVEVIVPTGFELVKEEDKNILLGDVYIGPVTTQFAGLGDIYIMPDQAAVAAHYNGNNPGSLNLTNNIGATPRHEGDTGSIESFWPCVGTERVVPELNSLYPGGGQAAPFAGATRRLCDRKEVILEDQASVLAKFFIFSSTHVAGHFTGSITNDFAAEFDPFSPQFGEKFGPPNLPVAQRDFTGNEVARVYSDQWGLYDGLYFSTYGVNPPNPTGYVPQMSIACMNDPGPIAKTDSLGQFLSGTSVVASADLADKVTDPAYNPAYSNFCYETAFMPGTTAYMDTPVIPTMAFADGYNLPDSEYPDATPAIASVVGSDGVAGPWVSGDVGHSLTITALGDKVVQNPNYSGPNAATAPYNQKTITRHYGFGATKGTVAIGGVTVLPANITSWSDTAIAVNVPAGVPNCALQQRNQPAARCGELEITAANGKRSIDTVTVTIGGKAPWVVSPTGVTPPTAGDTIRDYSANFGRFFANPLQIALDSATPGDLVIVTPGVYRENLLMWKPVRLQGVGAASVTINADAHPAGKMDPWRRQVNCVFGLTIDGTPTLDANNKTIDFDRTGKYTCPDEMYLRADRIPFEGFVGWDASSNGNLAQVLQEPSLMGAYEGAGVTATGRGIRVPAGSTDLWGQVTGAGTFPDGSTYLSNNMTNCSVSRARSLYDYGTANYMCNPSRIDGISITNSSQGGGGVFLHGWNHNLEIANTRIYGNHGTLSGGVNLGNGETPPLYTNDGTICGAGVTPAPLCPPFGPGTAVPVVVPNGAIPFQLNVRLHVHHNSITDNASIGDALFSGTPSGAGGITVSPGADAYVLDHNWVSGNLSTGDGGGIQHIGLSFNGAIRNNWILFNQSTNPTLPTNGGGLSIVGASGDRTLPNGVECGTASDVDCPPGIGDGIGSGNVVDSNLIMGNSAESGSGGGLRLQQLNGVEVSTFPTQSGRWYALSVTNNIIVNNVAGWDGGGVSMQDALKVTLINNTIASNDATASAGALFKTLGAINSSAPPAGCNPNPDPNGTQDPNCLLRDAPHDPQPAGLVTQANTPNLIASLPASVICPTAGGYPYSAANNGNCRSVSLPIMKNDLFWQNRTFRVDIVSRGSGLQTQQNLVALTPALVQTATGSCESGANYWDLGVRLDDQAVADGAAPGSAVLTLVNSTLTDNAHPRVTGSGNQVPASTPVVAQFCNGARVPPENCGNALDPTTCSGYNAPPGRSETTGLSPLFVFNGITPAATVDEGHNWLNLTYGPLTMTRVTAVGPTAVEQMVATAAVGAAGGAYSPATPDFNFGVGQSAGAPDHDYFNMPRPLTNVTVGAVQFTGPPGTADLAVSKTDGVSSIPRSTALTYTIVVTNNGPDATTGALVTDNRPAQITSASWNWTCTGAGCGAFNNSGVGNISKSLGTLAAGDSVTLTVNGTVTGSTTVAPNGSSLTNTVTVTPASGTTDTNLANNTATDTDTVRARAADLSITKTDGATSVSRGQTVTYTVVVANAGPDTVTGAVFLDPRPVTNAAGNAVGITSGTWSWTCANTVGTGCGTILTGTGLKILSAMAPGDSVTFTVSGTVSPTTAGFPASGATLTNTALVTPSLTTPDPNLANNSATDVDTVDIRTASLTGTGGFGSGQVAATTAAHTFTYTNTGNVPITVSTVTIGGVNPSNFLITSNGCVAATLAPSATCLIDVAFRPNTTGARAGTLTVTDSVPGATAQSIALTGTGVAAAATLTGTTAFGSATVGTQTAAQTFTYTNTGIGSITVSSVTLGGANPASFVITSNGCAAATLAAGASCSIDAAFKPAAAGARSASLTVSDAAGGATPRSLTLSGTGT